MRKLNIAALILALLATIIACSGNKEEECKCETKKYTDIFYTPEGFNPFFDLKEAQKCAKEINKPLLIDFTCHACMCSREHRYMIETSRRIAEIVDNSFVYVQLYIDDKTKLHPDDFVVTNKQDTLKSLGQANWHFQKIQFKVNAQPYFVVADHDFNKLNDHFYDMSEENFIEFLEEGIEKFEEYSIKK